MATQTATIARPPTVIRQYSKDNAAELHSRSSPPQRFTILAVSTGKAKDHSMNGHPVRSAIARTPLPSGTPLELSPENGIVGNESAAHNAQVYAFFAHHYDKWTSKLGIDRTEWNFCHWGENLTLQTHPQIDESDIHVGDVWRFGPPSGNGHRQDGEAPPVELEVVGGRVPCSRLAWRCGQKDDWLKEVADSGHCGVYLRVLTGGTLRDGDVGQILRTASDNEQVARISQMAFATEYSPINRATISKLLEIEGLQQMNRTYLQRKLNLLRDKDMKAREGWKGWREMKLVRVQNETKDTKSFFLRPADGKPLPPYSPGQFMTIKLPTPRGLTRCWSISQWQAGEQPSEYRLTIKKAGAGSKFLFDRASSAQKDPLRLQVRAPAGVFTVDRQSLFAKRQLYISAGIGLTPIAAMLQAHMQHDGLQKTPAVCVHITRNSSTLLFPDLLRSLPKTIQLILFFTNPLETDVLGKDYNRRGRPDIGFWKDLLEPPYHLDPMGITPIALPGKATDCYFCGPTGFEEDTRQSLKAVGVPDVLIKSESFAGSTAEDGEEPPEGLEEAKICFTKSKKEKKWSRDERLSILEIAEQAGLAPSKGCEAGICGSCQCKVVGGNVAGGRQKDGGVRICVAKPATQVVEIEL